MDKLQHEVAKGAVAAKELRFFDGESIWEPMQLEAELCAGAWLCVKAPLQPNAPLVTKRCVSFGT